jgi:streptogramin lyase
MGKARMNPKANAVSAIVAAVGLFLSRDGSGLLGDVKDVLAADMPRITTVAGTGEATDNGRAGAALQVNLGQPFGVEIGPGGDLFITEVANHRIWRLGRESQSLSVVAGTGAVGYAGDGGPATEALMNEPYEVRFDAQGNLYEVEMRNHVVRRIGTDGRITTIAGDGTPGFSGDGGPATKARLQVPHGIVLDGKGNLYIADIGNHRIRRVTLRTGIVETFAGTGEIAAPREGVKADQSPLPGPRALATDGHTLWVVLREGHAIWKIDLSSGTLQHVAGTGKAGYSGDGGPARDATFHGPKGLAVDAQRNLYVVDSENDAIRLIDADSGLVSTIGGIGKAGRFSGDGGPASKATLAQPHGICVDRSGRVYIGDTRNNRVRVIAPSP